MAASSPSSIRRIFRELVGAATVEGDDVRLRVCSGCNDEPASSALDEVEEADGLVPGISMNRRVIGP